MGKVLNIIVLVASCSISAYVFAGSSDMNKFQCGAKAIEIGMSAKDIKMTCGKDWKPAYISKHTRAAVGAEEAEMPTEDHFEKWMYHTAGRSDTHVILKNGEVIRIFTMVQQ